VTVEIHEVDVTRVRDEWLDLLRDNLPDHGGRSHFDWLYLRNPSGRARAWLAQDAAGTPIGFAAAFPRQAWLVDRRCTCWNLGDFAIRREFRSLGPAVALQRACLQPVMEGDVPFAYDHPHGTMLPVYRWLGIPQTAPVVRYAKPLRVDSRVRSIVPLELVGQGVARLGNLLLSVADLGRRRRAASAAVRRQTEIDARFDALQGRAARPSPIMGSRDADYLRWRYLEHPDQCYEILVATEGDELRGYAVFRRDGATGTIADLYAEPDPAVADGLLAQLVEVSRRSGLSTLSLSTLEHGPLVSALRRWGFRPRESSSFVVATARGGPWDGTVNDARNWFLTQGDRDV
jgi:hypothetical protein